ncbi:hypothetical protein SAMN05216474_0961 [Lishizhenia tianjinensis]|uniref:DUF2130 domain-containing protein n=1 Tax=Lishizhenia tianjinensis TaxID=477690 RepID=A0A1I6YJY7_9FLAO|nr:DUF2130 domain-containing protein [Lishizhenia tianjinensis]SFT50813.1 hypothetical protein SAMN05216474_0961 [Lishizhenia tianjinensis]
MNDQITCPNCGTSFHAEQALTLEIEEKLRRELQEKNNEVAQKIKAREEALLKHQQEIKEQELKLEEFKKKEKEYQQKRVAELLEQEKKKIEAALSAEISSKNAKELELIKEKLNKKDEELLAAQKKELELKIQKQEIEEQKKRLDLEVQQKILDSRKKIEEEIAQRKDEENALKIKEYQKQMEDQAKLIEEMKRKAQQGSMQLQGEVQELEIEEQLATTFPFDVITEVSKGIKGADCIQEVRDNQGKTAGKIVYESKRTKNWANDWVDKLKLDQRNEGADVAILITQVMPKEMTQFGFYNGIWVCQFHEFKALAAVIRDGLLKTSLVKASQENQGDKMNLLYNYMISPEFKHQIEAIVEGFSSMKSELDREKRAMQRIWKEREKQIDKVVNSTIEMYGSVRGIAGGAVQEIKGLEL